MQEYLKTEKKRIERLDYLLSSIEVHYKVKKLLSSDIEKGFIQTTIDNLINELSFLNNKKEWNFSFKDSGWNSVLAYTEEKAIKIAKEEYNDNKYTQVDEKSFRIATKKDTDQLLSLFY